MVLEKSLKVFDFYFENLGLRKSTLEMTKMYQIRKNSLIFVFTAKLVELCSDDLQRIDQRK